MKVTLLDTHTGKTTVASGISTFEWAENNWSCDCNRETYFGHATGREKGLCLHCKRYIIIAAEVEEQDDWFATLKELNAGYPSDLLNKHLS